MSFYMNNLQNNRVRIFQTGKFARKENTDTGYFGKN